MTSDRRASRHTVTDERALALRARRHHLAGPGAPAPTAAARAAVGIQAQVVAPALWSLAMGTPEPAEAAAVLTRDHLSANAPATVQDLAHVLGTRVADARTVLARLEASLADDARDLAAHLGVAEAEVVVKGR